MSSTARAPRGRAPLDTDPVPPERRDKRAVGWWPAALLAAVVGVALFFLLSPKTTPSGGATSDTAAEPQQQALRWASQQAEVPGSGGAVVSQPRMFLSVDDGAHVSVTAGAPLFGQPIREFTPVTEQDTTDTWDLRLAAVQAFQAEAAQGVPRISFLESSDPARRVPEWEPFVCVTSPQARARAAAASASSASASSTSASSAAAVTPAQRLRDAAALSRDSEYPVVSCANPTSGVMVMGPAALAEWNGAGQPLTWRQFRDGEAPVLWFSGDAGGRMPCVPDGATHVAASATDAGWVPAVTTTTELLLSSAAAPEGRFAVELTSHDMRVADYDFFELTWRASSDRLAEVQDDDGFAVTTEGYRLPRCTTLSQVLFDANDEAHYPNATSSAT